MYASYLQLLLLVQFILVEVILIKVLLSWQTEDRDSDLIFTVEHFHTRSDEFGV